MSEQLAHLPALMAEQLNLSRSEARRVVALGGVTRDGRSVRDLDVAKDGACYLVGKSGRLVEAPKR